MTSPYERRGDAIFYSNSGAAIAKNAIVVVENLIGVALEDIAATTGTGWVAIEGAFRLAKISTAVINQGENVVLDVSQTPDAFDDDQATPGTGDITKGAVALETAGNGTTDVLVRLMPGSGVVN